MENLLTKGVNGLLKLMKKLGFNLNVSDGYHTFDELYEDRTALFLHILLSYPEKAWKSKKHLDGSMFDGYFIAGINTPDGTYTYHVKDEFWELYDVYELPFSPEWDGHTRRDIGRLFSLIYS